MMGASSTPLSRCPSLPGEGQGIAPPPQLAHRGLFSGARQSRLSCPRSCVGHPFLPLPFPPDLLPPAAFWKLCLSPFEGVGGSALPLCLLRSFCRKATGASEGTWQEQLLLGRLLGTVWDGPSDPSDGAPGSLSQFLWSFPARLR